MRGFIKECQGGAGAVEETPKKGLAKGKQAVK